MIAIEAVTVCVGYADFLTETARHNRHIFDRWVVVTRPDDRETIECCRRHSLDCLTTRELGHNGDPFNKGRGIAIGTSQLSSQNWILHLDADIVLPRDTRRMLAIASLDKSSIYGVDRVCLHTWEEWKTLEASGYLYDQHGFHMVVFPPPPAASGELNCRIMRGRFGWTPLGYFQLVHGSDGLHSGWRQKDYSDGDDSAGHSDMKFAMQWDRDHRILIPEIFAVHLESERVRFGANWNGRKTRPFGPPGGPSRRGPYT
jgi:hypothetical protein